MVFWKKDDTHSMYQNYLDRGKSQYKSGQFRDALKLFEIALKYDPKSYVAWNWKGSALRRLGRYEKALTCYDRAISLDRSKSYPFPYIGKGDIYREQKLFPRALSEYERAINIKKHPWSLNGKAQCLYETGKKDKAFLMAEEAIRMRPSFVFPYILVGDISFDRGLFMDAKKIYQKAFSLTNSRSKSLRISLNNKIQKCQNNEEGGNENLNESMILIRQLFSGSGKERSDASYQLDLLAKNNLAGQIIRNNPFPIFESSLGDPVPEVRRNVQWILANLALNGFSFEVAESGILNRIAANLNYRDKEVQSSATWSLGVLAEAGQGIHVAETDMIAPCIRLLDDTNAEVRALAAFALDKVAFYASPEPLVQEKGIVGLASHILDKDTSVCVANLWALWSVACRGYSDSLCEVRTLITDLKLCAQSKDLEIRKAAISIIGELSTVTEKSFLENKDLEWILLTGIGSRSNRVRGASVWAAGRWADEGLIKSLIQNGVKEKLRNCRDDRHRVHVFYHDERRWKERSIGGIAADVLTKFDTPRPVLSPPCKSDYRTAYFIAKNFAEQLRCNKLQEARKTVIHLEQFVCGLILEMVQNQRDYLDFCFQDEIDGIPDECVNDAELLKETVLCKAMWG